MSTEETTSAGDGVRLGSRQKAIPSNETWCNANNAVNARCSMRLLMSGLALASTILLILPTILTGSASPPFFFHHLPQDPIGNTNENNNIQAPRLVEFQKQPGVVIVTKIHNLYSFKNQLTQSLCLLKHAYNHRVQYDIVVFTTQPIMDFAVDRLRQVVAPANLTVVWDNRGLQDMLHSLAQHRQEELLEDCGGVNNQKSIDELTWQTKCPAQGGTTLGYHWQAEFRALHIWNHPALSNYRYMLWMDSDAFCTQPWTRDPVVMLIQNQLAILFDHFPQGSSRGSDFDSRYRNVFGGKSLCEIKLTEDGGQLNAKLSYFCKNRRIGQIHGFFHITDMDFYRTPKVQNWLKILIGEPYSLRRRYDDQIAVTVPAAVWGGSNGAWEMEAHGFRPEVYHNKFMDGRPERKAADKDGFNGLYLTENLTQTFPQAVANCSLNSYG